jgi:chemotaxis protein MotB
MGKSWRHYQTGSAEEQIWAISYADMVTNLMIFFLMLYGLSRVAGDKRQDLVQGMQDKFRGKTAVEVKAEKVLKNYKEEEAATKVTEMMEKQGLNKYTQVEINEKQIKISLNIPVLFASGEAALTQEAKKALDPIAKVLNSVPNKVIVEGYTDNIPVAKGAYKSNWELSVARAYSVVEYFSKDKNIPPERFITAGYGEYKPVAPNDTPEGRAKNRRIELVMVR